MMKKLLSDIKAIEGLQVKKSNVGGGAGAILVLSLENDCCIWAWRYWEISCKGVLLATANDDDTPIIGKMAMVAKNLEDKTIKEVLLDEEKFILGIILEDGFELWHYPEKEMNEEFFSVPNWEYHLPQKNLCYIVTSQLNIGTCSYYE